MVGHHPNLTSEGLGKGPIVGRPLRALEGFVGGRDEEEGNGGVGVRGDGIEWVGGVEEDEFAGVNVIVCVFDFRHSNPPNKCVIFWEMKCDFFTSFIIYIIKVCVLKCKTFLLELVLKNVYTFYLFYHFIL